MKTDTKNQIIEFIKKNSQATPVELQKLLAITPQALHRHLKFLTEKGQLKRVGKPPRVYYLIAEPSLSQTSFHITEIDRDFLNQRYTYLSPQGKLLNGVEGFKEWAAQTKQSKFLEPLAKEFIKIRKETDAFFQKNLLINATDKFRTTFHDEMLNEVYYSDFYSLPKFGKTPLGILALYAKQAQDAHLIRKVSEICLAAVIKLVKEKKIEAIVWTPHSLPRKLQFLKELKTQWKIELPEIHFEKAYEGEFPVAQKSLSKLEERIQNANTTIFPKTNHVSYKRVLIIDDAVGSGATLEAIARKLKSKNPKMWIVGYAIVGSLKGFEVLKEV